MNKCEECNRSYKEEDSNSLYKKVFCSTRCQKIYEFYFDVVNDMMKGGREDDNKTHREASFDEEE